MASCLGRDTETRCVTYGGADLPQYGVKNGMDMETVVELLARKPEPTTAILKASDIPFDSVDPLDSFVSLCALSIDKLVFDYGFYESGNYTTINYNLQDIIKNLPDGIIAVDAKVLILKGDQILTTSSLYSGYLQVTGGYPEYRMAIKIRLKTSCGDIDLKKEVLLPESKINRDFKSQLEAFDLNPVMSSDRSVADQIKMMSSEIKKLKQDLDTLRGIDLFVGSIQTEIQRMRSHR